MKNNSKLLNYELLERETKKLFLLSQKEDLSLYQLKKIIKTLKLIEIRKHELSDEYDMDYYVQKRVEFLKKVIVLYPTYSMLILLNKSSIYLISLLMAGLITSLAVVLKMNSITKEENETAEKISKLVSNIEENLKEIKLNIFSKTKEIDNRKNNSKIDDIDLANTVILDILNGIKIDYEISSDIKELMIKILQDDLNSKETNIDLLISEAKIKSSVDYISDRLGIKRKVLEGDL